MATASEPKSPTQGGAVVGGASPIKVELNVPIPPSKNGVVGTITQALRALAESPIGASIYLPVSAGRSKNFATFVASSTARAARVLGTGKYTVRGDENKGVRVWRTA